MSINWTIFNVFLIFMFSRMVIFEFADMVTNIVFLVKFCLFFNDNLKEHVFDYAEGLTKDRDIFRTVTSFSSWFYHLKYIWSLMPPCGHRRVLNQTMFKTLYSWTMAIFYCLLNLSRKHDQSKNKKYMSVGMIKFLYSLPSLHEQLGDDKWPVTINV